MAPCTCTFLKGWDWAGAWGWQMEHVLKPGTVQKQNKNKQKLKPTLFLGYELCFVVFYFLFLCVCVCFVGPFWLV